MKRSFTDFAASQSENTTNSIPESDITITITSPTGRTSTSSSLPIHPSLPRRPDFVGLGVGVERRSDLLSRIGPRKAQKRFASSAAATAERARPPEQEQEEEEVEVEPEPEQTGSPLDTPAVEEEKVEVMPPKPPAKSKTETWTADPQEVYTEERIKQLFPYTPRHPFETKLWDEWTVKGNAKNAVITFLGRLHLKYKDVFSFQSGPLGHRAVISIPWHEPLEVDGVKKDRLVGIGDAKSSKKDAEAAANLHFWLQVLSYGLVDAHGKLAHGKKTFTSEGPSTPAELPAPAAEEPASTSASTSADQSGDNPDDPDSKLWTEELILSTYPYAPTSPRMEKVWKNWLREPKGPLMNYCNAQGIKPTETSIQLSTPGARGSKGPSQGIRVVITVPLHKQVDSAGNGVGEIVGIGDNLAGKKALASRLAALSAWLQILRTGSTDDRGTPVAYQKVPEDVPKTSPPLGEATVTLDDGTEVSYPRARQFVDWYCYQFHFPLPDISFSQRPSRGRSNPVVNAWDAIMTIDGSRLGMGNGQNKKLAEQAAYLDVTKYLAHCDPSLWKDYYAQFGDSPPDKPVALAPEISIGLISHQVKSMIVRLYMGITSSTLWRHRPDTLVRDGAAIPLEAPPQGDANEWMMDDAAGSSGGEKTKQDAQVAKDTAVVPVSNIFMPGEWFHQSKSKRLKDALEAYRRSTKPAVVKMRQQRASLPVFQQAGQLLEIVRQNGVVICMAATGSGKTTQLPQMILDEWIDRGEGSRCNILCTQPRRIAAVSVANRVAKERDERTGQSVGYAVRFETERPELWGSITFVTTGVFLRMMQNALRPEGSRLAEYSHIVVDEVHERDVDTDLTLAVLKRLIRERRSIGKEIKVILMSATIDPSLFTQYFADEETGIEAPVVEIPGRSFPVEKHYLDDILLQLTRDGKAQTNSDGGWVFDEKIVQEYIHREIGRPVKAVVTGVGEILRADPHPMEMEEIPYPLVALIIAYVIEKSQDGHVLVFLPGWKEITSVRDILLDPRRYPLGVPLDDDRRFEIHTLHSTVPLADQEKVFEPAPAGVRRIILTTNIAETSVTIPDVVYVVDTARVKEDRYEPDRFLSNLVTAWVGLSSLNQRAGRAGRHRPGEYYGLVSKARLNVLDKYNVVEMLRLDLSDVVMRIKALNFPGITSEQVLEETIEPPPENRVRAAFENLELLGALDDERELTSLGRLLLHVPIDVKLGKLCVFGCLFKCLDPALTIAALLSSRDLFVNPPMKKSEALAAKHSWTPKAYKSDVLAALFAFNAWYKLHARGLYKQANDFVNVNYLHKATLLQIMRLKRNLLSHLDRVGLLGISTEGMAFDRDGSGLTESNLSRLNENADKIPLLAALIAAASQPNFAIRKPGKHVLRTLYDKTAMMHPSSVNGAKALQVAHLTDLGPGGNAEPIPDETDSEALFAFGEKMRTIGVQGLQGSASAMTYLRLTTRVDPLAYILMGAHHVGKPSSRSIECDNFLPIGGDRDILESVRDVKISLESSILRVYEGIHANFVKRERAGRPVPRGAKGGRPRNDIVEDEIDPDLEKDRDELIDDEDVPGQRERGPLTLQEVRELELIISQLVAILERYGADNRVVLDTDGRPQTPELPSSFPAYTGPAGRSHGGYPLSGPAMPDWRSRPTTPFDNKGPARPRFLNTSSRVNSGANTPLRGISRPVTPTRWDD